jgi:hypothetical protein
MRFALEIATPQDAQYVRPTATGLPQVLQTAAGRGAGFVGNSVRLPLALRRWH